MLRNYFKIAIRNLSRNKVYSLINIAGLSIGLACAMLIVLYVKDEVSYDRFHTNVKGMYRIVVGQSGAQSDGRKMGITGFFQGPKFSAQIPEIKSFVRVQSGYEDIKIGTAVSGEPVVRADSNFLMFFTFPLLSGNAKTALSQPNSAVISEDEARKQFGTTDALGKIVLIRNGESFAPYNVTGVSKRCPQNSSIRFDVLLAFKEPADAAQQPMNWFSFFLATYVRLADHARVNLVESKMTKVYQQDAKNSIAEMEKKYNVKDPTSYALQPFTDMHLNKNVSQEDLANASNPIFSYILSGIAIFILFIACINFVNLTVARSLKRAKEIGIRKTAGSSRNQLIRQFLGESIVLCAIAFGFAVVIVQLMLPVFNNLSNKALSLSYLIDVQLVGIYFLLFIVTSFLAGFYPALVLSAYNPVETLTGRSMLTGKNYLQKILVIVQFSLASFLIICTAVIFSQFKFLTTEKLGYDDSNLVLVNKPNFTRGEVKLFKSELMKDPDIVDMAPKDEGYSFNGFKVTSGTEIGAANVTVDENYLPLLKIPVTMGRNFSSDYPADSSSSIIVNAAFVKKAGWKQPIGERVSYGDEPKAYTVIGVVKDYHFQSLGEEIVPELFSMRPQNDYGMAYIKIKPHSETGSLKQIEAVFKKLFPLNPYSYIFKDQENLKNYEAEARWKKIILFGAVLTIFISCIGLFGLTVSTTEKRTKEIGIRKVLGASVAKLTTLLSIDYLKLVFVSLVISVPVAWILSNKWLNNYPYRITLNWLIFAIAATIVVAIALMTVGIQTIKAAIANPVKSLRNE